MSTHRETAFTAGENRTHRVPGPQREGDLLPGFPSPVGFAPRRLGYVVGLVCVAGFVVLLPAFYLLLVGASGWGLLQHLRSYSHWWISPGWAAAHLGISAGGLLWLISMIKPLFAGRISRGSAERLARDAEPMLYECVDRVFRTVGVTPPKYIEVDHEANASARLGDSFWDLFTGRVSVVTIGLPLIAGLTEAQFVGVLAHECGHFRQQFGMRLSTLIRWNIHWLGRLVYEQDEWDGWLRRRVASTYCLPCHALRLFIWLARRLLWILMLLGRIATSFLLRQMELDADRYEVRIVGTGTFARTVQRLHDLAIGQQTAIDDMIQSFRDGRLTDNYPGLVVLECAQLADKLSQAARAEQLQKTGWLDTHPSDADRIRNAASEADSGSYDADGPASTLFSDFEGLCRALTESINRFLFSHNIESARVVPLSEFLNKNNEEVEDLFALKRFFAGKFNVERGIRTPPSPKERGHFSRAIEKLLRSSRIISSRREKFIDRASLFHRYDAMFREVYGETSFAPGGGRDKEHERVRAQLKRLDGQLATYELAFWLWIQSALCLLRSPIAGDISKQSAEVAREIRLMWAAAAKLYEAVPHFRQLKHDLQTVEEMLEKSHEDGLLPEVGRQFDRVCQRIASELRHAEMLLAGVVYPFERKPVRSICCYVFEKTAREEQSTLAAAFAFVDRFPALYARVIGRLTRNAEMVEQAIRT